MVALIAALVLAGPPRAVLSTQSAKKTAAAAHGSTVSVGLGFVPRYVRVAIAGKQVAVVTRGRIVSWNAARGGGVTVHATGPHGWVTYVGRLKVS